MKHEILEFLQAHENEAYSMDELGQALSLQNSSDFKMLVKTVATLEETGDIRITDQGKLTLPYSDAMHLEGVFRANDRGFGFVTVEGMDQDIFIKANLTAAAMNGDVVAVDITKPGNPMKDSLPEGKIVKIIVHANEQILGTFNLEAEAPYIGVVTPNDKKISQYPVYIQDNGLHPSNEEVCQVTITQYPTGDDKFMVGSVITVLGHKDDPGVDILSVMEQNHIPATFPEKVLEAAEKVPDTVMENEPGRRDLTDELVVTIDGESSKDLDDAVHVHRLENGNYFLGVHIADVSYYVEENSVLDKEAYERGTSVYLTDRVVPMLPPRLSNGICSLNPNVLRNTMSCEMEIDLAGNVVHYDIFPSMIKSDARMTYTAVNAILEDRDEAMCEQYAKFVDMFKAMEELHRILWRHREHRGAISFDTEEAMIKVDAKGKPIDIELRTRGVAEKMIESFMLVANETVAKHICTQHLPFIYRVHEQPKEEQMHRFYEFSAGFGLHLKGTADHVTSKELQKALEQVEGKPEEAMINTMLLRSMQQARYADEPLGHFGLAAEDYTHFTSPIRRYPDLIVHRLLRAYHTQEKSKVAEHFAPLLADIAHQSSVMERRAVDAEREVDAMKKAEYMENFIGQKFQGVISSVTKFGLFISLPNTIEGLVHMRQLKDDFYQYDERSMQLIGKRTGRVFKIGQPVMIKVESASSELREIDFSIVDKETEKQFISMKQSKKEKKKCSKDKKRSSKKKPFYQSVAKKGKKRKKRR